MPQQAASYCESHCDQGRQAILHIADYDWHGLAPVPKARALAYPPVPFSDARSCLLSGSAGRSS